jgi:hypothetical protein
MTYSNDKLFTIPTAFTALNGCVQTIEVVANGDLTYKAADESEEELLKQETSQRNLLRVLEILRSNGAQPIITSVVAKSDGEKTQSTVTFTVEQAHVYGTPGPKHQIDKDESREEKAAEFIKTIFGEIESVKFNEKTNSFEPSGEKLFAGVTVHAPINALC